MPLYRFSSTDVLHNYIETHPRVEFYVYGGKIYYNNEPEIKGNHTASAKHVPSGHISLYEYNIDKPDAQNKITPFISKDGSLNAFSTVTTEKYNKEFNYGDKIEGSYPMSASITREYYTQGQVRDAEVGSVTGHISALKNTLNHYTYYSRHYEYKSTAPEKESLGGWDKGTQELSLISVPSIFYGSSIEKGTVELNFYVTGSLVGKLEDIRKNGELVQTHPPESNGSGSVAGVVLYNEGFLLLTGSWDLSDGTQTQDYLGNGSPVAPKWVHWGVGANDGVGQSSDNILTGSSFELFFNGTNTIPVVTMFARAPIGKLNHSNNPTFLNANQNLTANTGSQIYAEPKKLSVKNIVSGAYSDQTASFKKQTYISKIGIYDKNKNLIGIAKLATPIKKTEERELTFKLKIDL